MEAFKKSTAFLWRQRIGYGSADFACNLIWQMISLYLLFFYTDIMQLSAAAISLMFVVTRVIDGVTDLLVGYAIDHTHTRWGQSRPYFLFGAIPFALFAVLAFTVPDLSEQGKLIYAFVTYVGLSFMYTVVNIPLASVLPSLTNDAHERTNLSTSRKFFGFLGASIVSACSLGMVAYFGGGNEAAGYHDVMLIFGIVGCLIFFFTFAAIREEVPVAEAKKVTLKETLHSLAQNRPWKIFAVNILFMWTGFFLQASALIYYFKYYVGSTAMAGVVASIMSIVPMLVNFLVPYLSKNWASAACSWLLPGCSCWGWLFSGQGACLRLSSSLAQSSWRQVTGPRRAFTSPCRQTRWIMASGKRASIRQALCHLSMASWASAPRRQLAGWQDCSLPSAAMMAGQQCRAGRPCWQFSPCMSTFLPCCS